MTSSTPLTPLRAAIVDDEPAARRGVRLLLQKCPAMEIVGEAGDVAAGIALLGKEKPDLVFLDVQMPGGNGFDVLHALPADRRPLVIFITAFNEHALRAFDVHAVDYLLKPYEDDRFFAAVARARGHVQGKQTAELQNRLEQLLQTLKSPEPEPASIDRILIKNAGEIVFLKTAEIDWVEADGDYMKFHAEGKTYLQRETMSRLEARLASHQFVRIHRSTIVNLERVRKLSPTFMGDHTVILHDGTKLRLSRSYYDRLEQLLSQAR